MGGWVGRHIQGGMHVLDFKIIIIIIMIIIIIIREKYNTR